MNHYKNYELFYVNGSSHTAAGGLETEKDLEKSDHYYVKNSVRPYYQKKYNVTWSTKYEVSWAARLSELIKIPHVNEAANGGGLGRLVRMTYEFIEKNWSMKNKIFLILEKPEYAFRTEVFLNSTKKYYIVNFHANDKLECNLEYATENYLIHDKNIHDNQDIFQNYLTYYHDFIEHGKEVERSFLGLYTFCRMNQIPIKVMNPAGDDFLENSFYQKAFRNCDIINLDFLNKVRSNGNVANWCINNNLKISDEIPEFTNDYHPGYFGQIEYAKKLKNWLDYNLVYNIRIKNESL